MKRSVFFLLFIFFCLTFLSSQSEGVTFDEMPHLAAGFSYVKTGDFTLNPEHPPLVKVLAGSALLTTDLQLPADWKDHTQYSLAKNLFYNENFAHYFARARLPMILLGVLLGLVIYLFARDLFGEMGGLLSLFMYSFSPLMIAHSRYVTTDIGVTLFTVLTTWMVWKYFETNDKKYSLYAGIALGLACATKYSSIYLAAAIVIIYLLFARCERSIDHIKQLVCIALVAAGVLVVSYGIVGFGNYFAGLEYVLDESGGRMQYLLGENYSDGVWYYFPLAFLFKTPVGTLLLIALGIALFGYNNKMTKGDLVIGIVAVTYLTFFMLGDINIGVRHIIPVYALLFVFTGRLACDSRLTKLVIVLCGVLAVSSLMAYPTYLSFFNEFIPAGSEQNYLIDSNLDWGQGVPRFIQWAHDYSIDGPLYVAIHGLDDLSVRGFETQEEACFAQNGYHVVSVNLLTNIYQEEAPCLGWLNEYEPIASPDPSLRVYHVTNADNAAASQQDYCDAFCMEQCPKAGMIFKSSRYEDGCKCRCVSNKKL